jgi:uncharacterized membrane protein
MTPVSSAAPSRWRAEDGNTLVLMPVAFLVLLALAAIAVDSAAVYLGQRRVADLAAGLANDAVAAIDQRSFYEQEVVRVDGAGADRRRARIHATLSEDPAFSDVRCDLAHAGEQASATCEAHVRPIFGRALRRDQGYLVRATETARAQLVSPGGG